MKFRSPIYDFAKNKASKNNTIVYWIWAGVLILLSAMYLELLPNNLLTIILVIFGLIIPIGISIAALFRKEEHSKKQIGNLEIESKRLSWNGQDIEWEDIEEISLSFLDFKGKFVGKGRWDFGNNRSNGLDNKIYFRLINQTNYQGNYLVKSKDAIAILRSVLWEVVKTNNISFSNAKRMINPINYQEHQEIKKYCS